MRMENIAVQMTADPSSSVMATEKESQFDAPPGDAIAAALMISPPAQKPENQFAGLKLEKTHVNQVQ